MHKEVNVGILYDTVSEKTESHVTGSKIYF